jgi:hypothetical protein
VPFSLIKSGFPLRSTFLPTGTFTQAVQCFYAPDGNVDEPIVCEMLG